VPGAIEVSFSPTLAKSHIDNRSTPLLQDWLGEDQAKRQRREVHFPTGRFGEAVEQAQAVLFLASDESSFVNGTDFVVDGGMTKCYTTPEGPPTEAPHNNARDDWKAT
jgi:NAD(P)-dependent dehydrogenase (short-subunit alcohol dehydrogenase family)